MSYDAYQCLKVEVDRSVAFVTIDHPPINLFDRALMLEFHALGKQLSGDADVKVAVFQSADPEFFIAHADVTSIQRIIEDGKREDDRPNFFQAMADRFRTMPKVTIAKIEGRARGGGSELALAMDMVFAAQGRAILSQPEVLLVPLLAFDGLGYRLGYGGGYYDRTLAWLRGPEAPGMPLAIGLGFAGQEMAALPRCPWDQPLDAIATEIRAFRFPGTGAGQQGEMA